jgi:alkyl sulfatase BDS1-like metallo-beta-lactamase superfamily hydrolase
VGGITFELFHARGETDDHTWVFCPDRGVLCPGDLIIWAVPNAGNPQKVQRYPWDWAQALRAMAAKQPRTLAPGHGGPVVDDPALVARILLETADFLELIVERTLAVLEAGSPPHVDVVRRVELPRSESPWLQPIYDEAEFIVRNVIRYFGGWYSGRPSELKPAPRAAVAGSLAGLAGGADVLVAEARRRADAGDLVLACHLADYALEAAPDDAGVQSAAAELYDRRAEAETSLMAINLFRSAAAYAREGRPYS